MVRLIGVLLTVTSLSGCINQSHHWGYHGKNGPDHWSELGKTYHQCNGLNQSPVNIDKALVAHLGAVGFNYGAAASELLNNGHTVQAIFPEGNSITIEGETYYLRQMHFHAPSEHTFQGEHALAEIHFVNQSDNGKLSVVAVAVTDGVENNAFHKLLNKMPMTTGSKVKLSHQVLANEFLPTNKNYYRINGSLTTPPCSEGRSLGS